MSAKKALKVCLNIKMKRPDAPVNGDKYETYV